MAKKTKIRQIQLVGHRIRQLRKQRRLTQTELAGRIGIQQSDLSRMEKGEYRVSLDTLFRILGEFNMSIGEFFDQMAKESFTPKDVHLVRKFNALGDHAQKEVQELIAFKLQSDEGQSLPSAGSTTSADLDPPGGEAASARRRNRA